MPKGGAQVGIASNGSNAKVVHREKDPVASGLLSYTVPYIFKNTVTSPCFNPSFGDNFAQDGSAAGASDLVHDGGDTAAWTASTIAGTWDFADTTDPDEGTQHISITNAANNDEARFDRASTINGSTYNTLRIRVNLVAYDATRNEMNIELDNAGVSVGTILDIGSYLDAGIIGTYQTASIPVDDFNISGVDFDGLSITISRTGGPAPTIYFDEMEFFAGGGLEFKVQARDDRDLEVEGLKFQFIRAATGSAVKAYNTILGLSVGDGFTINRRSRYSVSIGRPIRQIADIIKFGAEITDVNFIDDGTNTILTFFLPFLGAPLLLEGDFEDELAINVQGDFSGFVQCNCFVRGARKPSRIEVRE